MPITTMRARDDHQRRDHEIAEPPRCVLAFDRHVAGKRGNERGAHRALGEKIADEIGDAEGDGEGVHLVARAEHGEHDLVADDSENAAAERCEAGQASRAREAWLGDQAPAELLLHELVDQASVDRLTGEPGHRRLHHTAHILRRCGAGFRDGVRDGAFERGRVERRRQVLLEDGYFGGFLVDEILAPALVELLDRIAALLDERAHHLPRLSVVERAGLSRPRGSSTRLSASAAR